MQYVLDRLKEAGTYRSLIWSAIGMLGVGNYVNENDFNTILSALIVIAGLVSALMKEKKDVTITAVSGPNVATYIEKEKV